MRVLLTITLLLLNLAAFPQKKVERLKMQAADLRFANDINGAIALYTEVVSLAPDDAEAYHNRGLLKVALGDKKGAIEDYSMAILHNPELFQTYSNRGVLRGELGDFEGSLADHNKALEIKPEFSIGYGNRGFTKSVMGDKVGAIADFNRSLELDKYHSQAHRNMIAAKWDLELYEEALEDANTMAGLLPKDFYSYLCRAKVLISLGNFTDARADYEKAIQLAPTNSTVYAARANFRDDYEADEYGAIADYTVAIELDPENGEYFYERSSPRFDVQDGAGIVADCDMALKLGFENYHVYVMRGDGKDFMGDYEGALADYDLAIAISPDLTEAYFQKSIAMVVHEDYEAAIKVLDIMLEKEPDFLKGVLQRAGCNFYLEEFEAAISGYTHYLNADSTNVDIYIARAFAYDSINNLEGSCADKFTLLKMGVADFEEFILNNCPKLAATDTFQFYHHMIRNQQMMQVGDFEGAIKECNILLKSRPNMSGLFYQRAMAKRRNGDHEGAIADNLKAIELSPVYSDAYGSIGMSYYLQKMPEESKRWYQKSIDADSTNSTMLHNYAVVFAEEGNFKEATKLFGKAVLHKPDYVSALIKYASCLMVLGDTKQACYYIQKAESLGSVEAISKRILYCD